MAVGGGRRWCAHVAAAGEVRQAVPALAPQLPANGSALVTVVVAQLGAAPLGAAHLAARSRVFAPHARGLADVTLAGFVIHGAANQYPDASFSHEAFAQSGAVGTRTGLRWTIRNNTVLYAKTTALDFGSEGAGDNEGTQHPRPAAWGNHTIVGNFFAGHGAAPLQGLQASGTVAGNLVAGSNWRYQCGAYEAAGIKTHGFTGVMAGNLVLNNTGYAGVWFDYLWNSMRFSRNILLHNGPWAGEHAGPQWTNGLMMEISPGPGLVDNNLVLHNTAGPGVFGQDCENLALAGNLVANNGAEPVDLGGLTPRAYPDGSPTAIRNVTTTCNLLVSAPSGHPQPWFAVVTHAVNPLVNATRIGNLSATYNGVQGAPPQFASLPPPGNITVASNTPLPGARVSVRLAASACPAWSSPAFCQALQAAAGSWSPEPVGQPAADGALAAQAFGPVISLNLTGAPAPACPPGTPGMSHDFFGRPRSGAPVAGPFATLPLPPDTVVWPAINP